MTGRRLGTWEGFCQLTHEIAHGGTVVSAVLELKGAVAPADLERALREQARADPLLDMRIEKNGAGWLFAPVAAEAPLAISDGEDWQSALEDELSTPFDFQRGPLWRARLVRGQALIVSFHHSVADGASAIRFAFDSLRRLAGEPIPPPLPRLAPSIETALGRKLGLATYLFRYSRMLWSHRRALEVSVPFASWSPMPERRTRNVIAELAAPLVAALRKHARAEGTSVHGLITAAQLRVFLRQFSGRPEAMLRAHSAVDLRRFAPQPRPGLGCDIAVVETAHRVREARPLGELARECKRALDGAIDRLAFLPEDLSPRIARLLIGQAIRSSERRRRYINHTTLTNLGALELSSQVGAIGVGGVWFSSGRRFGDFPLVLHAVTYGGILRLAFAYEAPLLGPEQARSFADAVVAELTALAA